MSTTHEEGSAGRPTLGWLIASLTGGALLLSNIGCSATPDEEAVDDIEVNVPTQSDADAAATKSISASSADAEYQRLVDELNRDS
ncbi:MAG TPA: hypothetical protein VK824_02740 [Planctomycetota bacterium]|nr:hypothetical protein [Planctomycetota bacterium]